MNVCIMKAPFAPRIFVDGAASVHIGHVLSILREECPVEQVMYLDYNKSEFYRFSNMFIQIQQKSEFWGDFLEGERILLLERSMLEYYYGCTDEIRKRTPDLPIKFVAGLLKSLRLVIEDFIMPVVEANIDTIVLCSSRSVFYEVMYAEVLKEKLPRCKVMVIDNYTFESSVPYLVSFLTKKGYQDANVDCMLLSDSLFPICSNRFPKLFDSLIVGEAYDAIRTKFHSNYKNDYKFRTRWFNQLGEIMECCELNQEDRTEAVCEVIDSVRVDLDTLPLPDYSDMENIYDFAEIEYSRGCNYQCAFCERTRTMEKHVCTHSVEYMMRFFTKLKTYHFKRYTLIDCAMNNDEQATISLLTKMKKNNIYLNYQCNLRGREPNLELINLLRETGCEVIGIGLETGDDKVLKSMHKSQNKQLFKRLASAVGESGMQLMIFLIIGFPTETLESIDYTIEFLQDIQEVCNIISVSCELYYPGHIQYLRPEVYHDYHIEWSTQYNKEKNNEASLFFTELGLYGLVQYKDGMKRAQIRQGAHNYLNKLNKAGIQVNIPLN